MVNRGALQWPAWLPKPTTPQSRERPMLAQESFELELKRAYARGYNVRSDRWPPHRPPIPPDPIIGELVAALRELRDTADSQMACFGEGDEVAMAFDAPIERADNALSAVSYWLKERA